MSVALDVKLLINMHF